MVEGGGKLGEEEARILRLRKSIDRAEKYDIPYPYSVEESTGIILPKERVIEMADLVDFENLKSMLEKKGYSCPITTGVGGQKLIVCSTKEASAVVSQDRYLGYDIKIGCKNQDKCIELLELIFETTYE